VLWCLVQGSFICRSSTTADGHKPVHLNAIERDAPASRYGVLASDLKARAATAVVIFFFTVTSINIMTLILPLALAAGFALCAIIYCLELYHFVVRNKFVTVYPLIVLLSATWSSAPSTTAWYAFQFCLTVGMGILIGVAATPRQLLRGTFAAMAIVIVASVLSGRMGLSAVGYVLVGVTGGKSAMGYAAVTLVGSGIAVLVDREQPLIYRAAALFFIPVGGYFATHIESASALVVLLTFPVAFFGFFALRYLPAVGRWALIVLALTIAIPLSLAAYVQLAGGGSQIVLRALNKDATLTGRTIIWAKADEWIKQSPEIGYGFRSFWTSESSDSMGILHNFGLVDGRGFQIHNTVREILIDTGWLGLIVVLGTTIVFLYYVMATVLLYPGATSAFAAATYCLMIARTPIDTVLGIFYPPTILFYAWGVAAIVFFMNGAHSVGPRKIAASWPDEATDTGSAPATRRLTNRRLPPRGFYAGV
jgi:exopolysaccharide production protein ExoQ